MAMTPERAHRVLGVAPGTSWPEVRRAYLTAIRTHHPDRTGSRGARATHIIEAYRVLDRARAAAGADAPPSPPGGPGGAPRPEDREHGHDDAGDHDLWSDIDPEGAEGTVRRLAGDSLGLAVPADEAFRILMDAAHDLGEVTYLDRSGPILEVLCRFVGEPATSLVVTVQGRAGGTEAFCTATSIEARPGPPTAAVVDLLEDVLRRRLGLAGTA